MCRGSRTKRISERCSIFRAVLVTTLACALTACLTVPAFSQAAKKQARRQTQPETSAPSGSPRWLERVAAQSDFDRLARVYYRGRFYALPHLMFVIDRRAGDRVYYVNSKLYSFHKDFVNATYLSLERGRVFYENNYLKPDRRFLLGTIAWQTAGAKFTFEFWESDKLTTQLLDEGYAALSRSFFAPVFFKPNSLAQEEVANKSIAGNSGLRVLTSSELARDSAYQPLNLASGIGQLRILDSVTADTVIDRNQIVIFRETPV